MTSIFDEDTRIEPAGDGLYHARLSERWSIGPVLNGGYALAIAGRALRDLLGAPDPISVTGHFLKPTAPGDAEVRVEIVKPGRRYSTGTARLLQGGKECLRVLGMFGDLGESSEQRFVDGAPPELPSLDGPPRGRPLERLPEIARRFDVITAEDSMRWMFGERKRTADLRAAIRFADGRPPDSLSLLLFADSMPPPVFNVVDPGWVPTLELTVHCRARPSPGWLLSVFRTRFVTGDHLDEDGELWDESGQLVAMSRQIAGVPRAP